MRKFRGLLAVMAAMLAIAAPGYAAQKATFHTTWDDRFLYVACEVQDPDIISTNTTHMSQPWNDDGVEIFVDKDASAAANRTPGTYEMAVSAGGGSSWLIGVDGRPVPKTIYTFKYAAKVQGTINNSEDSDIGYVIEMALPWSEMGGAPQPGTVMGFNILWRSKGEGDGFVSLSPMVKAESEVQIPAKWTKIAFVANAATPIIDGVVQCPAVKDKSPVVDGVLSAGEWDRTMGFQLTRPESLLSSASSSSLSAPAKQRPSIERLVLATYNLDYQGETRKSGASSSSLWTPQGASSLKDHPIDGPGPWFSGDRVQWEKDQLQEAAHAGIDVLLVTLKYDTDPRGQSDALFALVQAMRELKAEKRNCPLLGLRFELGSDFGNVEGNGQAIVSFFKSIPDEFLASIQSPAQKDSESSYIVDIVNPRGSHEASLHEFSDSLLAQEIGGRHLLWVSENENDSADADRIRVAVVSPIKAGSVDRADSDTFTANWAAALSKPADWLIIKSWNDLRAGTEICPTMEFGDRYLETSRIGIVEWNGKHPWHAKFLHQDTPSVMSPGGMYQVTFSIKNSGRKPWYTEDGVFLAGRWYKDGFLYADSGARLPMQDTVLAGQLVTKTITVFAVDQDSKPLPAGDYELRWEMVRGTGGWFSNDGDLPVVVPVKIGDPALGFTLVSSTLPARMQPGMPYTVHVKVRNDGAAIWKAGEAKIGYRFARTGEFTVGSPLISDVQAGRVSDIIASVTLPVGASEGLLDPQHGSMFDVNRLHWGVFDGKSWIPVSAVDAEEPVQAVPNDIRLRFVASDTVKSMSADQKYGADIVVENASPNTWKKGDLSIGYHWYRIDGTEAVWDGEKSSIAEDVLPGGRAVVKATIAPPEYDGEYYLVWDVWSGGKWASTTLDTCGNSSLIVPVSVGNGKLVSISLDSLYNEAIAAQYPGGASPFELGPPLVTTVPRSTALWPGELWARPTNDAETDAKRISFGYPLRVAGSKDAISCKGQQIGIKSGSYKAIHILAVVASDVSAEFSLDYSGVKTTSVVQLTDWKSAPKHGEFTAFEACLTSGGNYYIKHYVLTANPSATLTGLVLPNNPEIKILAITFEKAGN
jgi:hypothetical protein